MAFNYGLVGIASIGSAGAVGSGAIRIFDLAISDTSAATCVARVFNGIDSANSTPYMFINPTVLYQHSDAGFRFPNGAFVVASGCTATVNYIKEL